MAFNPDQPRDEHGRWTSEGAAGGADARTQDVGGDKWNQETATRLENEYEGVRGKIDTLAKDAENNSEEVTIAAPAHSWDDLSGSQQEQAEQAFIEHNFSSEVDHEVENWHESGNSYTDAAHQIAADDDWKHEALKEFIAQREEDGEPRIPYTPEDLAAAIKITPQDEAYNSETKKPDIEFEDSRLRHPDNYDAKQQTLPGIEPIKPEDHLTQEMRDALVEHLTEKFVEEAEKKSSDMEPPDYISDSAKESLQESWAQMEDSEKYQIAKVHLDLENEGDRNDEPQTVSVPNKWDPLNETSGEDYRATQAMARYLQTQRGLDLLKERGITNPQTKLVQIQGDSNPKWEGKWAWVYTDGRGKASEPFATRDEALNNSSVIGLTEDRDMRETIANANHELWEGWKASSTNADGKLLQVAAHDELGARLNQHKEGISVNQAKAYADSNYERVGGYAGVKALVRATWETTQYMLDKADSPMLDLYRGITMAGLKGPQAAGNLDGKWHLGDKVLTGETIHDAGGDYTDHTRLPDLHVARNGAASWTTDRTVANDWKSGSSEAKVTLRAEVPRTAIISVPAYGVNIFSEHEVVVLGTAWKGWDAFAGRAPSIRSIPLGHVAKATPVNKATKAEKAHTDSIYKELTT